MRYVFGLVLAVGFMLAPAPRAHAQVAVSVGNPAYYSHGNPGYAYTGGYYAGYGGVSINVPGFSFISGSDYPAACAAPVATTYAPFYHAPSYYKEREAPERLLSSDQAAALSTSLGTSVRIALPGPPLPRTSGGSARRLA